MKDGGSACTVGATGLTDRRHTGVPHATQTATSGYLSMSYMLIAISGANATDAGCIRQEAGVCARFAGLGAAMVAKNKEHAGLETR